MQPWCLNLAEPPRPRFLVDYVMAFSNVNFSAHPWSVRRARLDNCGAVFWRPRCCTSGAAGFDIFGETALLAALERAASHRQPFAETHGKSIIDQAFVLGEEGLIDARHVADRACVPAEEDVRRGSYD